MKLSSPQRSQVIVAAVLIPANQLGFATIHLVFLHQDPQYGPQNQGDQSGRRQIFGNRHDCPHLNFPLAEILLAIAPIPRRKQGNFSALA
jgi:hypothetical protein